MMIQIQEGFVKMEGSAPVLQSDDPDRAEIGRLLYDLYSSIVKQSENVAAGFLVLSPQNEFSRDNLLSYLALREHDLSELQISLSNLGLSSLGRLEGDTLSNIEKVLVLLGLAPIKTSLHKPSFSLANSLLEED